MSFPISYVLGFLKDFIDVRFRLMARIVFRVLNYLKFIWVHCKGLPAPTWLFIFLMKVPISALLSFFFSRWFEIAPLD